MSLAAYMWACSLPMSACTSRAYRVLLKLADDADEMGRGAWCWDAKLAEQLETSLSTIRRGRRELLELGLISLGDQRIVDHIRADRRPTVYDLETPAKQLDDRIRARDAEALQAAPDG